jgi:hypothetical protein
LAGRVRPIKRMHALQEGLSAKSRQLSRVKLPR